MAKTLYLDCIGGVAGDMLLAALVDAGAPLDTVQAGLPPLEGLTLGVERVQRCGIDANLLTVSCPPQHAHRKLHDVRALIDTADMPSRARSRAHAAFTRLAEAEGRVHGVPADQVTFHEVGAVDAIADVCGVAMALESLDVDDVVCSPLPLGRGTTTAAHGVVPLPAPATLELLRGAEVHGVTSDGETVATRSTRSGLAPASTIAAADNRSLEVMVMVSSPSLLLLRLSSTVCQATRALRVVDAATTAPSLSNARICSSS